MLRPSSADASPIYTHMLRTPFRYCSMWRQRRWSHSLSYCQRPRTDFALNRYSVVYINLRIHCNAAWNLFTPSWTAASFANSSSLVRLVDGGNSKVFVYVSRMKLMSAGETSAISKRRKTYPASGTCIRRRPWTKIVGQTTDMFWHLCCILQIFFYANVGLAVRSSLASYNIY